MQDQGLAEAIVRRAEEERAQVLRAARQEAAAVRARAERDIEALRAAAAANGRQRGRRDVARLLSQARIEALGEEIRLAHTAITEASTRAVAVLSTAWSLPDHPVRLRQLLDEALRAIPEGERLVVVVHPRDAVLLQGAALPEDAEVHTGGNFLGGVVIETRSGTTRADNTLDARLAMQSRRLRAALGRIFRL